MKHIKAGILISIAVAVVAGAVLAGVMVYGRYSGDKVYDEKRQCLVVTNDRWNQYSYEVYEDHVVLTEYLGEEKYVAIPEQLRHKPITVIGYRCFAEKAVVEVQIPETVTEIEAYAFRCCEELERVYGDIQISVVRERTFDSCEKLKNVELGHNISRIERFAFAYCEVLDSIGEQPSLQYVGDDAFLEAGPVGDLRVSPAIELGWSAFGESKWLENQPGEFVILGDGVLELYNGEAEAVRIPEGVTRIDRAFWNREENGKIKEIYLPDTVESILEWAFYPLEDITIYIPKSVTAVEGIGGRSAFNNKLVEDPKKITIVTTEGSYAEAYAQVHGITYRIEDVWTSEE